MKDKNEEEGEDDEEIILSSENSFKYNTSSNEEVV